MSGNYLVKVERPNQEVRYLVVVGKEFKLVDSEDYATRYKTRALVQEALDAAKPQLPKGTGLFIIKRRRSLTSYGVKAERKEKAKKLQKKGKTLKDKPLVKPIFRNKKEAANYIEEQAQQRRKIVPLNPNPFPTYGTVDLNTTTVDNRVSCRNCGVCRECIERLYGSK